eukprot:SAG31_NODE_289_length_18388_cov_7.110504_11_plen_149_part_00
MLGDVYKLEVSRQQLMQDANVLFLKELLQEMSGFKPIDQILVGPDGTKLNDSDSIRALGLIDGTTLSLVVSAKAMTKAASLGAASVLQLSEKEIATETDGQQPSQNEEEDEELVREEDDKVSRLKNSLETPLGARLEVAQEAENFGIP